MLLWCLSERSAKLLFEVHGCAHMQAYREKTAELQKLEQDVIREAVVSSEIDVFLEEVSPWQQYSGVADVGKAWQPNDPG